MRWLRKLIPWLVIAAAFALTLYVPELRPEKYGDLHSLFLNERFRQANSGYSVVAVRNGRVIFEESFGHDGRHTELASDTPMYLGPSSEILTGALLEIMAERGEIVLDADVRSYVPRFSLPTVKNVRFVNQLDEVGTAAIQEETSGVKIRDLASHSISLDSAKLKEFESSITGFEAGEFDPEGFLRSRFQNSERRRTRIAYRVLGAAMEKASGEGFDELLQTRLLIPFGMHGTTARPDSLQGVALGTGLFFGLSFPYESRVPDIAAPADGVVTTIDDMGRFLSKLSAPAPDAEQILGSPPEGTRFSEDSAFGWRLSPRTDATVLYQGGSVEGFSSRIAYWPDRKEGIAILSSQGGVIQSNIVLPLLTAAAESILRGGTSPRLFPMFRALAFAGILLLVYVVSLLLQTSSAFVWAKAVYDRRETGASLFRMRLTVLRTVAGLAFRAAFFAAAPFFISWLTGARVSYRNILAMEPGIAAFVMIAMIAGCFRNAARIVWLLHLRRL